MNKDINELNKQLLEIAEIYSSDEEDWDEYNVSAYDFGDFDEKPLVESVNPRRSKREEVLDRIPPNNLDAEMRILGIYLCHPEKRGKHDRKLSDKFYFDNNGKIHGVMAGLNHLDLVLLADALEKKGELERVGGRAYLEELYKAGQSTNPKHLKDYIRIVREHSLRRELIHYSDRASRLAYFLEEDIGELVDILFFKLSDMRERLAKE